MSQTASASPAGTRSHGAIKWARRRARDLAPFMTLVILIVFFSLTTDSFLNVINLRNILAQVSTLAVVSTGITFVLLCGEIDLSIAAVAMMTGVVAAALFGELGLPTPRPPPQGRLPAPPTIRHRLALGIACLAAPVRLTRHA